MNPNVGQIRGVPEERGVPTPGPARIKVLNPMITTGPSISCELLAISEDRLLVRVPRFIVVGSTVQVRSGKYVAFGTVTTCIGFESGFEIGDELEPSA